MLIVVSNPVAVQHEAQLINRLFESGLELFHLRKPGSSDAENCRLLDLIEAKHHNKVVLHQHHHLVKMYGMTRLHLKESDRNSTEILDAVKKEGDIILSTSVHSFQKVEELPRHFAYVFLGPVFDSISKKDYKAGDFKQDISKHEQQSPKLIGIGGITKHNLQVPLSWGFDGVAVLGSVWQSADPIAEFVQIKKAYIKCGATH